MNTLRYPRAGVFVIHHETMQPITTILTDCIVMDIGVRGVEEIEGQSGGPVFYPMSRVLAVAGLDELNA